MISLRRRSWLFSLVISIAVAGSVQAADQVDPLNSPIWSLVSAKYLTHGSVVHDPRVKVVVPAVAENQAQVPITADARALGNVVKLVVLADLNPIQHVLTLTPERAEAYVSFRLKVEQGTPVRAAALTSDGVWHVGSTFLDAMGGGCSAPAMARKDADWSETVGQTQGRIWRDADGGARLRVRIRHPMDTGLAKDNTPAFYLETLDVKDGNGAKLATLEAFEPVGEDPTLTLLLRMPKSEGSVTLEGRDNNGGVYRSKVVAPWQVPAAGLSQ